MLTPMKDPASDSGRGFAASVNAEFRDIFRHPTDRHPILLDEICGRHPVLVRQGKATDEVIARFQLERRALAATNHSSIAKVFEAGVTGGGEPYLVMEFIEGLPLTTYCDKHRLSIEARLRLFKQICAGVHHAHMKGIVHRDLKPGNVLVAREGDEAVPKIVDFGLAKAMNRDFLAGAVCTESDRVMGTLEYMAPEQAARDGEGSMRAPTSLRWE